MFRKLKEYFDPKYTRISIYFIVTVLITFMLCLLLYNYGRSLSGFWTLLGAILKPMILGAIIAYLFEPVVAAVEGRIAGRFKNEGNARKISVLITYAVLAIIVILILTLMIITVTKQISSIDYTDIVSFVQSVTDELNEFWSLVQDTLKGLNINLGSLGSKVTSLLSNIKNGGSVLLFALIFSVYFLLDNSVKQYWFRVRDICLKKSTVEKMDELLSDMDRVFSGYIRGQSLDALLVAVMLSICLLMAGVPYALIVGLLTGLGNLIPYVGSVAGFLSLSVACLAQGSFSKFIIGLVLLAVVMTVDGNIINPKLLSDNVEVHPVLVVAALLGGGQVGGMLGMLIAVPAAAFLKLQFEKYLKRREEKQKQEDLPQ